MTKSKCEKSGADAGSVPMRGRGGGPGSPRGCKYPGNMAETVQIARQRPHGPKTDIGSKGDAGRSSPSGTRNPNPQRFLLRIVKKTGKISCNVGTVYYLC